MLWKRSKDNKDFRGQNVLITGGAMSIGIATAQAFLRRGAQVHICSKRLSELRTVENQLSMMGTLNSVQIDVSDKEQVQHNIEKIYRQLSHVDILVNNAAILWKGDFVDEDYESIDAIVDVNIKGVMYVTRSILPYMIERRKGVIINLSSSAGLSGHKQLAVYSAAKFAVNGFTEGLDREVREYGVRVYALCPRKVETEIQDQYPSRNIGRPSAQLAEKILLFASLTGAVPTNVVHSV